MKEAHVPCKDDTKAIQASSQIIVTSGLFSKQQITEEWEEKTHTDKTWTNLKTYYSKLYKNKMQYSKGDAHRNGHESANAMQIKEKEMDQNLEAFIESFQKNLNTNQEEINEIKQEQQGFNTLGAWLMNQMKAQQAIIEKLSQRLEDKENTPPSNKTTQQALINKLPKQLAEAEKRLK
jgi:type I site-specific restriction endonuclease